MLSTIQPIFSDRSCQF